jgi:hypothetical protein
MQLTTPVNSTYPIENYDYTKNLGDFHISSEVMFDDYTYHTLIKIWETSILMTLYLVPSKFARVWSTKSFQ